MASKIVVVSVIVCIFATIVQSAPQFPSQNQYQPQQFVQHPQQFQNPHQQEQRNSRFLVVDDQFHQAPNGEYNFQQRFASGEQFNEEGKLKAVTNAEGNSQEVIVTRGSYTIIEKDGSETIVNYTADEHGFHPEVVTSAPAGKSLHF